MMRVALKGDEMEKLAEQLEMLPGEEKVFQLGNLQLTDRRVVYVVKRGARKEIRVAMVKDIDSVTFRSIRPSLVLIIFGIFLVIVGILFATRGYKIMEQILATFIGYILLLIGTIMIGFFFLLRKKVLVLTVTGRDWLTFGTGVLGRTVDIEGFINKFFAVKDALHYPGWLRKSTKH